MSSRITSQNTATGQFAFDQDEYTFNGVRKTKIYLAGPISNCNPNQRDKWRNKLTKGFGEEFEFIDPAKNLIEPDSDYQTVVEADIESIKNSDAVLANMWRESIGTAFGIIHAHSSTKVVVVCDPNYIQSRMIDFYADEVTDTVEKAIQAIRTHLAARRRLTSVTKLSGDPEPFDLQQLLNAIVRTCQAAGQNTTALPKAILRKTLDGLLQYKPDDSLNIPAQFISEQVEESLRALQRSRKDHDADYKAILQAWLSYRENKESDRNNDASNNRYGNNLKRNRIQVYDSPQNISLASNGTHSNMWGQQNDIRGEAAEFFKQIKRVEGLVSIVLTRFTSRPQPASKFRCNLSKDKSLTYIYGNCIDNAQGQKTKGTLQEFRLTVANPDDYDEVYETLVSHLRSKGYMK